MSNEQNTINFIGTNTVLIDEIKQACDVNGYDFSVYDLSKLGKSYDDSINGQLIVIDPSCLDDNMIHFLENRYSYHCDYYWKFLTVGKTPLSERRLFSTRLIERDTFPDAVDLKNIMQEIPEEAKRRQFMPTRTLAYLFLSIRLGNAISKSIEINIDEVCQVSDISEEQLYCIIIAKEDSQKGQNSIKAILNRPFKLE